MPLYKALTREQVTERVQAFSKARFPSIRAAGEYFGYVGNDTFYGYYYGKRPVPPHILRHLGMDLVYVEPVPALVEADKLLALINSLLVSTHGDKSALLTLRRHLLALTVKAEAA